MRCISLKETTLKPSRMLLTKAGLHFLRDYVLYSNDNIPLVNVLKGNVWNSESQFDAEKDKSQFRKYEVACERVKNFYKEQHGDYVVALSHPHSHIYYRETDDGVQHQRSCKLQEECSCQDGYVYFILTIN